MVKNTVALLAGLYSLAPRFLRQKYIGVTVWTKHSHERGKSCSTSLMRIHRLIHQMQYLIRASSNLFLLCSSLGICNVRRPGIGGICVGARMNVTLSIVSDGLQSRRLDTPEGCEIVVDLVI